MPIDDSRGLPGIDRDDFGSRSKRYERKKLRESLIGLPMDHNSAFILGLRQTYHMISLLLSTKVQEFREILRFSRQGYTGFIEKP